MRPTLMAVTLLTLASLLPGPVRAQESPPPGPESKADRQRNNAAKLAGLVGFVRTHCPDLSPDDARLRAVVARLGVPFDDLQAGDLHLRALAYAETYARDVPANCARAVANFGETGQTIPGLIAKR